MYIKIEEKIVKINLLSENEVALYFYELCQIAKSNPWRRTEFHQAEDVLEEMKLSPFYLEMKEELRRTDGYREKMLADSTYSPKVNSWASAMAKHHRK